jgi:hypothetical protein
LLIPNFACPKCGEWYFAIYMHHDLWKIYPVLPKTEQAPLCLLLCPQDGHGLVPWLIEFDASLPNRTPKGGPGAEGGSEGKELA